MTQRPSTRRDRTARAPGTAAFSLAWLRLREPFDTAARDPGLTLRFAAALPAAPRLLDLGAGSGANFRYLAPRLGGAQSWLLVDNDAVLLAAQAAENTAWRDARLRSAETNGRWRMTTRALDLATGLEQLALAAFDGVVAAALIDLVSPAWLAGLVAVVAAARLPLLIALTVDGRAAWQPEAEADGLIAAAFARHQTGDKGFGPALGGAAAPFLAGRLADAGYAVATAKSDWSIAAGQTPMLSALVDQFAEAAAASRPDAVSTVAAWAILRHRQIAAGSLSFALGHRDVLGLPPD